MSTAKENAEIAVLQSQMVEVKNTLLRIEGKVDSLTLIQNEVLNLKTEIANLKVELAELKHSKTILNWAAPLATAILTAAFTYLILQKLG